MNKLNHMKFTYFLFLLFCFNDITKAAAVASLTSINSANSALSNSLSSLSTGSNVAGQAAVSKVAGNVAVESTTKAASGGLKESVSKFTDKLSTPMGVGIMSTIAVGMNTILYQAASEQEAESKANSKKIEEMIKAYKDTFKDYCPNGRDKLEEPKCYCYLETGKKNDNRSNSETCQKLWAKDDIKLDGTKDNYLKAKLATDLYGCMTINNQFDENCRCKKLKNEKGENACMKADQLSISIPSSMSGFAKNGNLSSVLGQGLSTANGNGDLGNLNAGSLAVNAERSKKAAMQLLEQSIKKTNNPDLIKGLDILKSPEKAIIASEAFIGNDVLGSVAGSSPLLGNKPDGDLANSIKSVEADLKKNGVELSGGAGVNKAKNKKDGGFKFAFNEASSQGGQVLNLPESGEETKKYKITGDINKNSDSSIFDILSNRYMQSGLRRLIEEE